MKVLWILALCALTVSAVRINEADRVDGVNGWNVPQPDGTFEWIDMEEAEAEMDQLQLIQERARAVTPVTFHLYTAANPNQATEIIATPQSISNSNFNPKNPTRFVIHGFGSSIQAPINQKIRQAWLGRGNCNFIFVDWPQARSLSYGSSVSAVPSVGKVVAQLINFLVSNRGVSLDNVHLVGGSLGAHVAGFAGKNVIGQVRTIVALDAAGPLYNGVTPEKRLAKTDAFYVESIHTNGGGLGLLEPIGNADFYVNGGKSQPGCLTSFCSHTSAVTYYAEAVEMNNFRTIKCGGYLAAVAKNCGAIYSPVLLGAVSGNFVSGVFYVPVSG